MPRSANEKGLYFFGPREDAEGGIATVLRNYRQTEFWTAFRCRHCPTMAGSPRLLRKLSYEAYRFAAWLLALTAGTRPIAASVHCAQGGSFYRKLAYLLVLRLMRIPIVLHIHPSSFSTFYREGGHLRKSAIRLASRLSDQVVFLSEGTRLELADVIPMKKSCSLANPVDASAYSAAVDNPLRCDTHVLFLGWIIREKGVYDLVDAMPEVLQHYPGAKFTFAGNKEVETLRNLIESRGLSGAAVVPGWVSGEQRLALFRSATVLVLPSYTEGLPNVILEAMASGLPVVATPVGAIPDVIRQGETGLLVEPGNAASLAAAILTVFRDETLRRHIASKALQLVRTNYSLDAVSAGLTAIYSRYLPEPWSRPDRPTPIGNSR
jgi:glycosyltransferase involved in cell wall biosynthesis